MYIGHEVDYLYDGQMPVWGQEYEDGVLQQTRVNFLGARGIEAVVTIDHTRGNQVSLRWLLYDGHGNLMRTLSPDYTLSAFQWRGVWGEVQGSLGTGRGYCANLGHPEDETGLVYMRARYYEPAMGRFISEDPARDGVNWYLYADGNPVNRVDVEGKKALDAMTQITIVAMLIGFMSSLGAYIAYGQLGLDSLTQSAKAGLFAGAVSWFVAWVAKYLWGTEGLAARIPLRVGYAKGFATVGISALAAGIGFTLLYRAGQALFEIFLMEMEDQLFRLAKEGMEHSFGH